MSYRRSVDAHFTFYGHISIFAAFDTYLLFLQFSVDISILNNFAVVSNRYSSRYRSYSSSTNSKASWAQHEIFKAFRSILYPFTDFFNSLYYLSHEIK